MRAEILAFGTELLMGETLDTNSAHIAARLPALGVDLHTVTIMGDEMGEMVEMLHKCLERSDVIICTAGSGPPRTTSRGRRLRRPSGRPSPCIRT